MAVPTQDFLDRLAAEFPEYWTWLQSKPKALSKVSKLAEQYAAAASGAGRQQFMALAEAVKGLGSFARWTKGSNVDDGGGNLGEPEPGEEGAPEEEPTDPVTPTQPAYDESILDLLTQFLNDNELPSSLVNFIKDALAQKMPYAEIIARLRQTPEYLAAYPENALRREKGLSWWAESRIREYRDQTRRLLREYLGIAPTEVSNLEIGTLISGEVDLSEWERRLQTHAAFLQWGPVVKQALSLELGYEVPDERTWAFMNADIPTPELDLAYRRALMRGQPSVLGFGIRPEEEADVLLQFGYSPEAAFQGYQGVAQELPRIDRLKAIERYLNQSGGPETFLQGASFGQLFNAVMLKDVNAYQELQALASREMARWRAGGGPAGGGLGLAVQAA